MSSAVTYPSVLCSVCGKVMTTHRCLHPAKRGLLILEVIGTVCGRPVCGPCNYEHGNETLFRCPSHSAITDESSEESVVEMDKENVAVISETSQSRKSTKTGGKSAKAVASSKGGKGAKGKGNEYTAKDLLILSQAYIKTSEDAVDGTSKRQSKFWDEVAASFNSIKKRQEAYDARHAKRQKFNAVNRKSDFLSDSDEVDDEDSVTGEKGSIPNRTASSLQQKWSKFILPLVTKFITLTYRHPKLSGEGMFLSCLTVCYL